MENRLPVPVEDATDIAKFTSGVLTAVAAAMFPAVGLIASLGQLALNTAIDRHSKRPQAILEKELRAGNLSVLTDEQKAAFVPMAFRFFEAARQGEYEHVLEVLAAFITGELKREIPDAGDLARMARRLEGISKDELKLIALLNELPNERMGHFVTEPGYDGFSATALYERLASN